MIFDNVNITEELKRERKRSPSLKDEIDAILSVSANNDEQILSRLKNGDDDKKNYISISETDKENIFTISNIEKICINYRLRFLDSKYFKNEFPYDAIIRINEFEKRYNTKIKKFKIIAPDHAFDLADANSDPLLFAQLSNNKFYLLHQWGNDLAWYRKYLYLPIRNIYTYFYSIIILAAIISFSIPFEWFKVERNNEIYMRMWLTMHCTIGLFFFILFLGATAQASFSSMIWKSKYWNE